MKNIKLVIVSPNTNRGGAIVLHYLCNTMIDLGYDAKVFTIYERTKKDTNIFIYWLYWLYKTIKEFVLAIIYKYIVKYLSISKYNLYKDKRCSIETKRKLYFPFISKNTIVIYPDIMYGNVLHAKKVIRYLLYYYSYKNDKNAYGKDDIFYTFSKEFNDMELNPKIRTLNICYFDFNLYRQTNYGERYGCCYIIRKGKKRNDLPKEYKGPIIDNYSEIDKVKAFNTYKFCYIYDTNTAYTKIATICGCIPILKLQNENINIENNYGIALNESETEINKAIKTRNKQKEEIENRMNKNIENIKHFINEIEIIFNVDD